MTKSVDPVSIAAQAARQGWMSERAFRASVTATSDRSARYVGALFTVRHRRAVLRTAPASRTTSSPLSALPDPIVADPWLLGATATRVTSKCPACAGEGFQTCGACDGATTTRCGACGGQATGCRTCGGDGKVACACLDGKDSCDICSASGCVEAWLEAVEQQAERLVTTGDPSLVDAAVSASWRGPLAELPADFVPEVEPLLPAARHGERIEAVAVEVRSPGGALVSFRVLGIDGEFEVRDGEVVRAVDGAMSARLTTIAVSVLGAFAWAVVVLLAYVARDPGWYTSKLGAMALLLFLPALPAVACMVAAELSLPAGARRLVPRLAWTSALAGLLLTQALVASSGRPTVEQARAALAAGDLHQAGHVARALRGSGLGEEAIAVLDQVALAELTAATDIEESARIVAEDFEGDAGRAQGAQVLLDRVDGEALRVLAAGDWRSAERIVGLLPQDVLGDPKALAILGAADLVHLDACIDALDAACAEQVLQLAAAHHASEDEIKARRIGADKVATERAKPLWSAIKNHKNAPKGRFEACAAALGPVRFGSRIGTGAARPTIAELDAECHALGKGK